MAESRLCPYRHGDRGLCLGSFICEMGPVVLTSSSRGRPFTLSPACVRAGILLQVLLPLFWVDFVGEGKWWCFLFF